MRLETKSERWSLKNPSWLSYCILVSLMLGAVSTLSLMINGIGDSDYYWHITLGKYIVTNKAILKEDIFSWLSVQNGYLETAHSWAGSVLLYLNARIWKNDLLGAAAYYFMANAALAFTILRLYGPFFSINEKNAFLNSCIGILTALAAVITVSTPRPLILGLILFSISLNLLERVYDGDISTKTMLVFPIISIIWANVHGGSLPILFAYNMLYLVVSFIPSFNFAGLTHNGADKKRTARLFKITVADLLAGLINPYSYKLYTYFFITNNEATKKYVNEWQSAQLKQPGVVIGLTVIIATALLANRKVKIRFCSILASLSALIMTARYCRIQSYLVITAINLFYLTIRPAVTGYIPKKLNTARQLTINTILLCCTACMLWISGTAFDTFKKSPELNGNKIMPAMEEKIRELNPERMYNSYNAGGYLIYHGIKSYIDSRADLFSGEELEGAVKFISLKDMTLDELREYLERNRFDAVLIENKTAAKIYLQQDTKNWHEEYSDDYYSLFSKI